MQAYIPPASFGNMENPTPNSFYSAQSLLKGNSVSGNYPLAKSYEGRRINPVLDPLKDNPISRITDYSSRLNISDDKSKKKNDPLYTGLLSYSLN